MTQSPEEQACLAAYQRRRGLALLVFAAAAMLGGSIVVLAIVRPDLVFRTPVIAFLPLAVVWLYLTRHAYGDWIAARRDRREGGALAITGPARLRQKARPGLFAGLGDTLLVEDRSFSVERDLADRIIPGRTITVRYAPHSGALLSVEEAGGPAQPEAVTLSEPLTRRERELLALIAEGLTDKDIARRLNLSPATVRTYNSALYAKLGITRRTQAVAIAAGLDLTSVD